MPKRYLFSQYSKVINCDESNILFTWTLSWHYFDHVSITKHNLKVLWVIAALLAWHDLNLQRIQGSVVGAEAGILQTLQEWTTEERGLPGKSRITYQYYFRNLDPSRKRSVLYSKRSRCLNNIKNITKHEEIDF